MRTRLLLPCVGATAVVVLALCAGTMSRGAHAAVAESCTPPSVTTQSWQNSGLLDWNKFLQPNRELKAIMLFVDYSDRPATETTTAVFNGKVPRAVQWFNAVSYGRMSLNVTPVHEWFRMPRESTGYISRARPSFSLQRALIGDAINKANPTVDFNGYDLIYVVSPRGSGVDYSPAFTPTFSQSGFSVDGGTLNFGATFGNDFYVSDFYGSNVLIHETGHSFGLPDLYNFSRNAFPYSTFVGDWDPMGNFDLGEGLVTWQRLQLGWVDPGQIECFGPGESRDVRLTALELSGGTKAAIVRTGATSFTVAENRQAIAEDSRLCDTGMLVYTVEVTTSSGSGPLRVQPAEPDDGTRSLISCGPFYKAAFSPSNAPYSSGGVGMKVLCTVGVDLVVRVAYGVPLGTEQTGLCPPPAPTAATATAGDGSATVSFTPTAGPGAPALYYTVTASPGGQSASGLESPITVGGLDNGTSYTFRVTGTNGAGTGTASAASAPVVPAGQPREHPEPPVADGPRAPVPEIAAPTGVRPSRPTPPTTRLERVRASFGV